MMGMTLNALYNEMTIDLDDNRKKYCIQVFDTLIKHSIEPKYMTVALPVARGVVEDLIEPLPSVDELAETIIKVYQLSYLMYVEKAADNDDVEAEAAASMRKEIANHFNK